MNIENYKKDTKNEDKTSSNNINVEATILTLIDNYRV